MKKFLKKSSIALAIVFASGLFMVSCGNTPLNDATVREGNMIFIESQSSQAPYIKFVTRSKWTHCGILVNTPNGIQVLEASNVVKLTPIDKFISKSKNGSYRIVKVEEKLTINYKKYLGIPYDLEFKFNNGKYYCSELLYEIFKDNGITLCKTKKVSDYWLTRIPKVKRLLKKRGIKAEYEVVSPADIVRSY